jgi:hypothetical protein
LVRKLLKSSDQLLCTVLWQQWQTYDKVKQWRNWYGKQTVGVTYCMHHKFRINRSRVEKY